MAIFGLGRQKPHHYREMVKIAWENRGELPFAWRILRDGVCDGCALGTSGLSDWTIEGVHLCMVRLELMRLRGERGFRVVSWNEALDRAAAELRHAAPARVAFYLTSRGITNEVYY